MGRSFRSWTFVVGAATGFMVGSLTVAVMASQAGDLKSCRVRIENVEVKDDRTIELKYSWISTYSSRVQDFSSGLRGSNRAERRWKMGLFTPWHGSALLEIDVGESLKLNRESLIAGLRVETGRDYELTPLNPLEFFHVEKDDVAYREWIELR